MNEENIRQTIARLVKEVYGVTEINVNTTINSFNAVSEDNEEFLKRFEQEFQVDMTGFNYYDFFREDQFYSLALLNLIMRLFRKERKSAQFTINHLIEVARNRKWSPPA